MTDELLRLNAVVGVKDSVDETGQLTRIGVTCALCDSSVDNSSVSGIGRRCRVRATGIALTERP